MNPIYLMMLFMLVLLPSFLAAEPQHPGRTLDDPLWPEKAKMVSSTEGIIEAFWAPNGVAETRWHTDGDGLIERFWDRVEFRWELEEETKADAQARIHRPYDLYIGDFEELVFRVNLSPDMEFKLIAENDSGQSFKSEWTRGEYRHMEVAIPIEGERLAGVEIHFRADTADRTQTVELRWLMLRRSGVDWVGSTPDYERFIRQPVDPDFSPGLGVLLTEDEVDRLRELSKGAPFKDLIDAELDQLKPWLEEALDPVAPRFSLYAWMRYGRVYDSRREWRNGGLLQGYYGMLKKDPELMEEAARILIRLAATDEWEEGFMTSNSFVEWAHSGFSFNVTLIQSALLLDWVWEWLTPEGRVFVAQAMRDKGLAKIDQHRYNHANQGARFHKGIILARLALAKSRLGTPFDNHQMLAELRSFESHFLNLINEDGTFVEADGYGMGTLQIVIPIYQLIARETGTDLKAIVPRRIIESAHFYAGLTDELPHPVSAFVGGLLGETELQRFYKPGAPLEGGAGGYSNPPEWASFGTDWLWMDRVDSGEGAETRQRPVLRHYPVGGWIISKGPELSFTLDAGYWIQGGHTRPRKGDIEVGFRGEPFLIRRASTSYNDSRFRASWRTRAFNTFKPVGKTQDGLNENERGAEVKAVESLEYVDAIEIDNHTAWLEGVDKGIRRLLYIPPGVLLVEDDYRFTEPGEGFQIWNSLEAIEDHGDGRFGIRFASGEAMLEVLNHELVNPVIAPNSVHRSGAVSDDGDVALPVNSIRFESPSQENHRVLTLVTAWAGDERPKVTHVANGVIEVTGKDDVRVRIAYGNSMDRSALLGVQSDGELSFVVHHDDEVVEAGAFGATLLRYGPQEILSEERSTLTLIKEKR
ncbi:MAG: hypothetical protein JJU20_00400 [Opitutales bacterium]|nr:hypothetical protein [Opitutales bacterium]